MALRALASSAASSLRIRCAAPVWLGASPFHAAFSSVVEGLKYAESHEWVKVDGKTGTVGITDHAQEALGDVVFVELPEVGASVTQGKTFGVVESVKAASDVYSPISGTVVEVNAELSGSPALVNSGPFEAGWIMKVELSDPKELGSLLDAKQYTDSIEKAA